MSIPLQEFTQQLSASGLVSAADIELLLEELPAQHKTDAKEFARTRPPRNG